MSQMVGLGSPTTEAISYGFLLSCIPAFIMAVSMGKSLLVGVVSLLVSMAFLIPLVYHLDTRWRDKKLVTLESVADRLEELAAEKTPPSRSTVGDKLESRTPGLLDLDDEISAGESRKHQQERKTRS